MNFFKTLIQVIKNKIFPKNIQEQITAKNVLDSIQTMEDCKEYNQAINFAVMESQMFGSMETITHIPSKQACCKGEIN